MSALRGHCTKSRLKANAMDAGTVATIVVLVLLLLAIVTTASYIGARLQIDPLIVVIVGIFCWPAWLILLLVAAGKTERASVRIPVAVRPPGARLDEVPSLSQSALRGAAQ